MLSAEHLSLQSRLVQQLISMRQREMDYLLSRFDAIGTQAALLAGFAITSLTALTPSSPDVSNFVKYAFNVASVVTIIFLLHVVLSTLVVATWAPGLALRGPTGSMARAFNAARGESTQINVAFVIGCFGFGAQTTLAVWILDEDRNMTPQSVMATVMMGLYAIFCVSYMRRLHARFFGKPANSFLWACLPNAASTRDPDDADYDDDPPDPAVGQSPMPLLDNPVTVVSSHPDVPAPSKRVSSAAAPPGTGPPDASTFEMTGILLKRVAEKAGVNGSNPAARPLSRRGLPSIKKLGGEWRERYFVLKNGHLTYYKTETDYLQHRKPGLSRPINLRGFEVMVDMSDPRWGFSLVPASARDKRREWYALPEKRLANTSPRRHFRAKSEQSRLQWSEKLVVAALTAPEHEPVVNRLSLPAVNRGSSTEITGNNSSSSIV